MAKELTEEERAVRRNARKIAKADGKDWLTLSQEERRACLKQARRQGKGDPVASGQDKESRPGVQKAKELAKAAGKQWRDLSKEQRQSYLSQVGQKP